MVTQKTDKDIDPFYTYAEAYRVFDTRFVDLAIQAKIKLRRLPCTTFDPQLVDRRKYS